MAMLGEVVAREAEDKFEIVRRAPNRVLERIQRLLVAILPLQKREEFAQRLLVVREVRRHSAKLALGVLELAGLFQGGRVIEA